MEAVAELCLRNDLLISDEIWSDRILDRYPNIPIASIDPEIAKRTVVALGLGDRPAEVFERTVAVVLSDGTAFGSEQAGFVRRNFGCPARRWWKSWSV